MMTVRRRAFVVIAVLFVAAWLVPTSSDAAVSSHAAKHARFCQRAPNKCLAWKEHISVSRLPKAPRPDSDDVFYDFEDRDTGIDPAADAPTDDHAVSSSVIAESPSWVRVLDDGDPRAARLIDWRKLDAPRPPPSL
jgi:hypothetical protein